MKYYFCLLSFISITICRSQNSTIQDFSDIQFQQVYIKSDDGLQAWENIDKFYEDSEGIIWAIIDDGLYRYNGSSAINVTNYLSISKNLDVGNQSGTTFLIDNDSIVWYGERKGLYKIDLKNLKSDKVILDKQDDSVNWSNYILKLKSFKDTLFVGTANGLFLINKQSNAIISKYLTNGIDVHHRESSNTVESIYPNIENGAIWVALMNGLYKINKNDTIIEKYTIEDAPYSNPHNLHEGQLYDDVLLMPSHGLGMVEFDLRLKKFTLNETKANGNWLRENNIIRSAIPLNDSISLVNVVNLGNGLYNRYSKTYKWLMTPEAMKDGVFLNLDRSGYVWASKRGRIFRSTKPVVASTLPFNHILDISCFKVNDVLKKRPSIDGYDSITLNETENNIELDFSISKPYILDSISYQYNLDNKDYIDIYTENTLKLFGVKSGQHQLNIRAINAEGIVLANRNVNFNISIPFYKTTYFLIICFLILLLIMHLIGRYLSQQKTNTKLKELDKLKSNFFTNISHEFRTPLTLITSPIDDTLSDTSISDQKRQQFTVAKQNSERLLSLVNQVLDLSKIDAGQLKLHIEHSNITTLLSALSKSFSYAAKQSNINYKIDIKQTDDMVWFDKDALEKITVNLVSNALKYTPENGSVTFNSYTKNNSLFLEVKNTGKGLTSEELNHIFQRFYQTNEQNQGTGIGLALVKELVELHKGTIVVTSVPNEWTTFSVILPVDRNSFKNEDILINANTIKAEVKIPYYSNITNEDNNELEDSDLPILLIVEDNDDLRALLKHTFDASYNVLTAVNGVIGVELALEHIPDLIISDIMMPEKDGIALTKELKNDTRCSHVPIILLTAKADIDSQFEGVDTGADDYITKPFDKNLLVLKVEKLIECRIKLQSRYSQEVILRPKDIAISNLDEKFLEKVQEVLDKNLVESSFSTEDFSKAVGLSRMQLHRKIKALTGLTASEFIRSQRLKLAAQLLKSSDINISQIGYTVGFNDHSYFAKCFKEAYKCTPTAYSKKYG